MFISAAQLNFNKDVFSFLDKETDRAAFHGVRDPAQGEIHHSRRSELVGRRSGPGQP